MEALNLDLETKAKTPIIDRRIEIHIHAPLFPFVVSSITWAIIAGVASVAPTYSATHVCLILCGSPSGHLFAVLFLTWICYVLRGAYCGVLRFVECVRGRNRVERGRYFLLPVGTKIAEHNVEEERPISVEEYGNNHPRLRRHMIVIDCALIITLYGTLCFIAWWLWAPSTFDVSAVAKDANSLAFPSTFLFGAATSSYQVEGNIFNNQWTEFENSNDDASCNHISKCQHCGLASDVWNRFDSDLEHRIVSDLNLDAFRLSVEWARVEPQQGVFDEDALDRYASWVKKLRDNGVEPIVTLHHFSNPIWFERMGAFENSTSSQIILPFVRRVVEKLGPYVNRWITMNEIMVYAGNGYLMGEFPPGRKGELGTMLKVVGNMLRTHEAMYHTIKQIQPTAKISIAKNTILYQPASYLDLFSIVSARVSDLYYNQMPIRVLQRQNSIDYLALNTYFRMMVSAMGTSMGFVYPPERQSDMGWDLEPQVLYQVVKQYHAYMENLDILITEHGVADGQSPDRRRVAFVRDSLLGLALATNRENLPVVGYMHWSLLDNWEWSSGYDSKFGLYRVDLPDDQERNLTEGGKLYKELVATRIIPV